MKKYVIIRNGVTLWCDLWVFRNGPAVFGIWDEVVFESRFLWRARRRLKHIRREEARS